MATQFNPQTLTQIGRYTVVRFIAEGGMSWVFEVRDPRFPRARRALKLIKPDVLAEGEMLERFDNEVQLLAEIEHPNLVRVYDYGTDTDTDTRFYTMEVIEGPHLGQVAAEWLIEPGSTMVGVNVASLAEIADFFLGVLSALARIHARGVFHRDIKPANVTITTDGVAKLLDFGIARDTHKAGVTRLGMVPGTPAYMSPEQSLDGSIGATSDLFSLGLTLYTVLAGHSVYAVAVGDETKTGQVLDHLRGLYRDRGEFRFEFPPDLPIAFHNWISNTAITDLLNTMLTKQLLVVSDSCYAGSLSMSVPGQLRGVAEQETLVLMERMGAQRSRMVLTSGGVEPVADGPGGTHSVFARSFIELLEQNVGVLPGQELFQMLQLRIAAANERLGLAQVPDYAPIKFAGHESGDFFFVKVN